LAACENTAWAARMWYNLQMTNWYILPNGNLKHPNGLELQPEKDWFPTDASLAIYTDARREAGAAEEKIILELMELAIECEAWVRENLR